MILCPLLLRYALLHCRADVWIAQRSRSSSERIAHPTCFTTNSLSTEAMCLTNYQTTIMATVTLKNSITVQLSGELPAVGSVAPNFTAVKADLSEISLDSLRGQRVVLNIFPSIDTGVCAASVRRFNKELANLSNTTVLCLSKDLPFALGRFCGAEGLDAVVPASGFRYESIEKGYGILQTDGPLRGLFARAVVILDEEGKVIYTELVPEITQDPNFDAALAVLK